MKEREGHEKHKTGKGAEAIFAVLQRLRAKEVEEEVLAGDEEEATATGRR